MNVLLMTNWGIGLEILKALHQHPQVGPITVISRFNPSSIDPYENRVYQYAKQLGYSPINESRIDLETISDIIDNLRIDLLVTHAYMRILPEYIFTAPPKGSINIHPSLLPKYRGPAPTTWVLKNHEKETGLTCHYIDKGIDTGRIIHQVKVPVLQSDTVNSIIEKEKTQVRTLIDRSLSKIGNSTFIPQKQNEGIASYAPKIPEANRTRI